MTKNELQAKALFLQKLSNMLDTGTSLLESLAILADETVEPKQKNAIVFLIEHIKRNVEKFDMASALDAEYFSKAERVVLSASAKAGRFDLGAQMVAGWVDRECAILN